MVQDYTKELTLNEEPLSMIKFIKGFLGIDAGRTSQPAEVTIGKIVRRLDVPNRENLIAFLNDWSISQVLPSGALYAPVQTSEGSFPTYLDYLLSERPYSSQAEFSGVVNGVSIRCIFLEDCIVGDIQPPGLSDMSLILKPQEQGSEAQSIPSFDQSFIVLNLLKTLTAIQAGQDEQLTIENTILMDLFNVFVMVQKEII